MQLERVAAWRSPRWRLSCRRALSSWSPSPSSSRICSLSPPTLTSAVSPQECLAFAAYFIFYYFIILFILLLFILLLFLFILLFYYYHTSVTLASIVGKLTFTQVHLLVFRLNAINSKILLLIKQIM